MLPVQGKEVARLHRMPKAARTHTQQTQRHKLTWHQPQPLGHSTPFHSRFSPRSLQAAAPTRQPWKPLHSTLGMSLLDQGAKAASRSGARDLPSPRARRLGQMAAMVTTQPMRLNQAMGITQSMGTMLTMRWDLCTARARSRLRTGRQSRMIRVLA